LGQPRAAGRLRAAALLLGKKASLGALRVAVTTDPAHLRALLAGRIFHAAAGWLSTNKFFAFRFFSAKSLEAATCRDPEAGVA